MSPIDPAPLLQPRLLSFIKNMRKVVYACPRCGETSSLQMEEPFQVQRSFHCAACQLRGQADFSGALELARITR